MLIFNNHFYYFMVIINIFIGCYYDIQNIRYMRIRYVYDLFKHKSHINAYILCRCYFNGGIMGLILSIVTKMLNYIYIPKSEYIFNLFIILFHSFYLIDRYLENNKILYTDILAVYGFHSGFYNLIF